MTENVDLVVARSFSQPYDAHLACSALEAAGLLARVADHHIVAADWLYSNAVGGVKVLVRIEDLATAQDVLETAAYVIENAEMPVAQTDDACPYCGSEALSAVKSGKRLSVLSWLIVGIPLFPVRRRTLCRDCGHTFR